MLQQKFVKIFGASYAVSHEDFCISAPLVGIGHLWQAGEQWMVAVAEFG
jgi:hypothetical protein